MEIFMTVLVTLATLAAAIAAWMSYLTSKQSFSFQKKLARNQNRLHILALTSSKLKSLKTITNLFEIPDEKFISLEPLFLEIKSDIQKMTKLGILKGETSIGFRALTFGEMLTQNRNYIDEINHEIGRIETAINEIFD